jgi:diguanylate cyclase
MTALAEGVETAARLEALIELGCDQAQGYLFGMPRPIHELWRERPASSVATA